MIAALLCTFTVAIEVGVQVVAVLTPLVALLATAAMSSARVRRQFGCAGYLFTLALYALAPVAIRAAGWATQGPDEFGLWLPNFYIM
ncbi:hypothetical protein ABZ468_17420 [Streptomyces sp. NPDC005708]|uniref:hypothetical protein n=1 Tax=Streptomyces sp. NPDC005708 TaxID=3154564 RepID=UPI0033D2B1CD